MIHLRYKIFQESLKFNKRYLEIFNSISNLKLSKIHGHNLFFIIVCGLNVDNKL